MNSQGLDYIFIKNVGIIKKHIIDNAGKNCKFS